MSEEKRQKTELFKELKKVAASKPYKKGDQKMDKTKIETTAIVSNRGITKSAEELIGSTPLLAADRYANAAGIGIEKPSSKGNAGDDVAHILAKLENLSVAGDHECREKESFESLWC